jgi:hypothetical protein
MNVSGEGKHRLVVGELLRSPTAYRGGRGRAGTFRGGRNYRDNFVDI